MTNLFDPFLEVRPPAQAPPDFSSPGVSELQQNELAQLGHIVGRALGAENGATVTDPSLFLGWLSTHQQAEQGTGRTSPVLDIAAAIAKQDPEIQRNSILGLEYERRGLPFSSGLSIGSSLKDINDALIGTLTIRGSEEIIKRNQAEAQANALRAATLPFDVPASQISRLIGPESTRQLASERANAPISPNLNPLEGLLKRIENQVVGPVTAFDETRGDFPQFPVHVTPPGDLTDQEPRDPLFTLGGAEALSAVTDPLELIPGIGAYAGAARAGTRVAATAARAARAGIPDRATVVRALDQVLPVGVADAAYDDLVEASSGPVGNVDPSQINFRPDLFQRRDVPGGQPFDAEYVQRTADAFDVNQFDPPLIVPDPDSPGQFVALGGNHSAAIAQELQQRGTLAQFYPEGRIPVRVADFDISDPEQLARAQRTAIATNYTRQATGVVGDLNAVSTLAEQGTSTAQISEALNIGNAQVRSLLGLRHTGPQIIERVRLEPDLLPAAGALGNAAEQHSLTEETIGQVWAKMLQSRQDGRAFTPREVTSTINRVIPQLEGAQGGFEGFSDTLFETTNVQADVILSGLDTIVDLQRSIAQGGRDVTRIRNIAEEIGRPELANDMVEALTGRTATLQDELSTAQGEAIDRVRRQITGEPEPAPTPPAGAALFDEPVQNIERNIDDIRDLSADTPPELRNLPPEIPDIPPETLLVHRTQADISLQELIPGDDGIIHFHNDPNSTLEQIYQLLPENNAIEGALDVPLERLPEVADITRWNPLSLADEFVRNNVLTPAERQALEQGLNITQIIRELDEGAIRSGIEPGRLERSGDLLETLTKFAETDTHRNGINLQEAIEEVTTARQFRSRLFDLLAEKGVSAFRYRNIYETSPGNPWSVGIIDPKALREPRIRTAAPSPPDADPVIRGGDPEIVGGDPITTGAPPVADDVLATPRAVAPDVPADAPASQRVLDGFLGAPGTPERIYPDVRSTRPNTPREQALLAEELNPILPDQTFFQVRSNIDEATAHLYANPARLSRFVERLPGNPLKFLGKKVFNIKDADELYRIKLDIYREIEKQNARLAAQGWWDDARTTFGFRRDRLDVNAPWQAADVQLSPGAVVPDEGTPGRRVLFTIQDIADSLNDDSPNFGRYALSDEQLELMRRATDTQTFNTRRAQWLGAGGSEIGGFYFRRIVQSRDGEGAVRQFFQDNIAPLFGESHSAIAGRGASPTRSRIYETVEDGAAAGITYQTNPVELLSSRLEASVDAIAYRLLVRRLARQYPTISRRAQSEFANSGLIDEYRSANNDLLSKRAVLSGLRGERADWFKPQVDAAEARVRRTLNDFQNLVDKANLPRTGEQRIPGPNETTDVIRLGPELRRVRDDVFLPDDVFNVFREQFAPDDAGILRSAANIAIPINTLLRLSLTTMDGSVFGVQGLPVLARNPAAYFRAAAQASAGFAREPTAFIAKNAGLIREASDFGAISSPTEFIIPRSGPASVVGRVPLVGAFFRGSNRTFEWFSFTAQTELWRAARSRELRRAGLPQDVFYSPGELPSEVSRRLARIGRVVRRTTGSESSAILGQGRLQRDFETALFFAPRYYRAYLGLIQDAFVPGPGQVDAARALGSLITAGAALTMGWHYAFNQELPNMTDDTRTDFWRIKVGESYFFPMGSFFGGLVRTLTRTARLARDESLEPAERAAASADTLQNWVFNKTSPVIRFVETMASVWQRGEAYTFDGDEIDLSLGGIGAFLGEFVPIGLGQAGIGLAEGRPEALGEIFGINVTPANRSLFLDDAAEHLYGQPFDDLNLRNRRNLRLFPDFREELAGYDVRYRGFDPDNAFFRERARVIDAEFYQREIDSIYRTLYTEDGQLRPDSIINGTARVPRGRPRPRSIRDLRNDYYSLGDEKRGAEDENRDSHGVEYPFRDPSEADNELDRALLQWFNIIDDSVNDQGSFVAETYRQRLAEAESGWSVNQKDYVRGYRREALHAPGIWDIVYDGRSDSEWTARDLLSSIRGAAQQIPHLVWKDLLDNETSRAQCEILLGVALPANASPPANIPIEERAREDSPPVPEATPQTQRRAPANVTETLVGTGSNGTTPAEEEQRAPTVTEILLGR